MSYQAEYKGEKLVVEFPNYAQRRFMIAYIKYLEGEASKQPMETVFYDKTNYHVVATSKTTEEQMIFLEANIAASMTDTDYEERMYYLRQVEIWAGEHVIRIDRRSN
jgi:hypothetical protein